MATTSYGYHQELKCQECGWRYRVNIREDDHNPRGSGGYCPNCGFFVPSVPLPVEPLFSVSEVCALVPVKLSTLRRLTTRYKARLAPAKYVGVKTQGKRLYTAEDVKFLRAVFVRAKR